MCLELIIFDHGAKFKAAWGVTIGWMLLLAAYVGLMDTCLKKEIAIVVVCQNLIMTYKSFYSKEHERQIWCINLMTA